MKLFLLIIPFTCGHGISIHSSQIGPWHSPHTPDMVPASLRETQSARGKHRMSRGSIACTEDHYREFDESQIA
ncbi:hypothetical protein C8R48DRAFT_732204 [Suillus tomentosus]|nr:hypothetical protein C8R48DRAFT_732204 [Suillus tomentosus]